eukprot:c22298_g1_i1 orf=122-796(+)
MGWGGALAPMAMLVAMKGHPGSGKSTIARAIGRALHWPVVDKDDIRDCSVELSDLLSSSCEDVTTFASSALNCFSYCVMWRVAQTQLDLGLSVIVDSTLSRPTLYLTAAALAQRYRARLLVIECVSSDIKEWERRLVDRAMEDQRRLSGAEGCSLERQGWHKPSCWEDLEKLVDGYNGCWEYDMPLAKKLVIDTTSSIQEAVEFGVVQWIKNVEDCTPALSYLH